mmetsp:Transcript_8868/g.17894  ORF Transcript_8868/g.17894 Transcript_8868/m.17894 type:complete len:153 (+) Transcript_8868:1089-1547(+)
MEIAIQMIHTQFVLHAKVTTNVLVRCAGATEYRRNNAEMKMISSERAATLEVAGRPAQVASSMVNAHLENAGGSTFQPSNADPKKIRLLEDVFNREGLKQGNWIVILVRMTRSASLKSAGGPPLLLESVVLSLFRFPWDAIVRLWHQSVHHA